MSSRVRHLVTILRNFRAISGVNNFQGICTYSSRTWTRIPTTRSLDRYFANTCKMPESKLDAFKYEKLADETLEKLSEEFDHWLGSEDFSNDVDSSLSNGVLTITIEGSGTYVINKQSANQQIWLSSPFSGPKRYDFVDGKWMYSKDQVSLDSLLSQELSKILKSNVKVDLTLKQH